MFPIRYSHLLLLFIDVPLVILSVIVIVWYSDDSHIVIC